MGKKKVDTKNSNNIKDFPLSRLADKWPFCLELAEDLFYYNKSGDYSSFKEFLIDTWLEYCEENSEEFLRNTGDENTKSWSCLKYDGFFIKNDIVFFQETADQKRENIENLTEKDSKVCIYTLEKISYRILICEATRFYINSFFQGKVKNLQGRDESRKKLLEVFSIDQVWTVIFDYLLFTPYSFYIRKLLEEEKYTTTYKEQIIFGFYLKSKKTKSYPAKLNSFLDFFLNTEIEENLALENLLVFRERFQNLFYSSGLSTNKSDKFTTNESDKLIDNFFSTKSFNEIASFYENYKKEVTGF